MKYDKYGNIEIDFVFLFFDSTESIFGLNF